MYWLTLTRCIVQVAPSLPENTPPQVVHYLSTPPAMLFVNSCIPSIGCPRITVSAVSATRTQGEFSTLRLRRAIWGGSRQRPASMGRNGPPNLSREKLHEWRPRRDIWNSSNGQEDRFVTTVSAMIWLRYGALVVYAPEYDFRCHVKVVYEHCRKL